ncbi:hypothetical protein [Curtobacterium sp. MCPF17_052]|uniref:hypothetical protein n=1 Tax=Curtobacterium sp. MCPF17_052 TaxID=2175655 RepID=UPI0024DF9270|nr:hypothetical protein [Curtobacterium sp. MCPF17_052]WIB11732.1 hypothetical protein DEJ36_12595 [Curtobacterium sp. MCPF17_052]
MPTELLEPDVDGAGLAALEHCGPQVEIDGARSRVGMGGSAQHRSEHRRHRRSHVE